MKKTKVVSGNAPDPAVRCAHAEIWTLDRLKPNPRNPNTHPPEQLRLLAKVIAGTGWRAPIVVSRRSGFVVKGHGRLAAAKLAGLTVAPVDLQDYASEAEEWADMIADNRLAELAEISMPDLKDLLQELDTGNIDMEITGFTENALEELMTEIAPEVELAAKWQIVIDCRDETQQRELLERFIEEKLTCRALTL